MIWEFGSWTLWTGVAIGGVLSGALLVVSLVAYFIRAALGLMR